MAERTAEFILGLIGGISGILVAPALYLLGGVWMAFGGPATLVIASIVGGILSILGLIGVAFVKTQPKLSGVIMLISGILGLIVALGLYVGALLLTVAGIITLVRTEKPTEIPSVPTPQPAYYCTNCGKPLKFNSQLQRWYCESCGVRAPTKDELLRYAMKALDQGDTELAKKFMDQARSMSEST